MEIVAHGSASITHSLVVMTYEDSKEACQTRKKSTNLCLDSIILNWEARMESGPIKERRTELWFTQFTALINVDGSARGKPSATYQEYSSNNKVEMAFTFSKHLRIKDLNRRRLAIPEALRTLVVFYDKFIIKNDWRI